GDARVARPVVVVELAARDPAGEAGQMVVRLRADLAPDLAVVVRELLLRRAVDALVDPERPGDEVDGGVELRVAGRAAVVGVLHLEHAAVVGRRARDVAGRPDRRRGQPELGREVLEDGRVAAPSGFSTRSASSCASAALMLSCSCCGIFASSTTWIVSCTRIAAAIPTMKNGPLSDSAPRLAAASPPDS